MDENLSYIINHVFSPPKLPQENDLDIAKERKLCMLVHQSAEEYRKLLPGDQQSQRWDPIIRMLANLCDSQKSKDLSKEAIKRFMAEMKPGDVSAMLIRAQNAGLILRRFKDKMVFESFEASPPAASVMAATGKLVCAYPGPATAVFSTDVDDPIFREELASFLMHMNVDVLDSAAMTTKAGSTVTEERDSAHPRYITQLLTGILRGIGQVADISRIWKRIGDDVLWKDAEIPWRRSPLWLVIRVALQTSLYQESKGHSKGHSEYKAFMVFFMAKILELVLEKGFSSDLIFCMRAKMSRRLYKIGSAAPDSVLKRVHVASKAAENMLQERWSVVQKDQSTSARWAPDNLNIPRDIYLSLLNSETYLSQILHAESPPNSSYAFKPNHSPRYHNLDDFEGIYLSSVPKADLFVALADFELAVQNNIDDWVNRKLHDQSRCSTVAAWITQYSNAALKLYKSNPEDQSLMLLTIFELWVALDKITVAQCQLLQEYSPEIPFGILEPLLLRRSKSFGRLASIEKYLRDRHHRSYRGSIFTDKMDNNTFAVRYFDGSAELKSLQSRIEREATQERQRKLRELQQDNDSHAATMKKHRSLDHDGPYHHRWWSCPKCSLERQANEMKIAVYEWPLPEDSLKAKAVVFELDCPLVFGVWRVATYQVLRDICMPNCNHPGQVDPPVRLETYQGLNKYFRRQESRITFASSTKSFMNSHYKTTRIPSVESLVCVNNGLQFKLFDSLKSEWASESLADYSVVPYCTLQLPEGPYRSLQYAVDGTFHTSNQVIANQSECPKDLNLHEYIAFISLRSGHRLQWLNIARELSARSLSFHKEDVHILLTQAAWQIGHLSQDGSREWHTDLSSQEFCLVLLQELEDLMLSVEASWLEGVTLRTIISLTIQLLASTSGPCVVDRARSLLRKARDVTFGWVQQLTERLQESEAEDQVREFQLRVCEMAATCRGTYDVDPTHVGFLLNSPTDVKILVACAILLCNNTPPSLEDLPLDLKRLLHRDRRLSHLLENSLRQQIHEDCEGLDNAVNAIWKGYSSGIHWEPLERGNDRWLVATTAVTAGKKAQEVELNLLEGRLLIDGKPLGRLPQSITQHATYTRIFGQKILDVVPSDDPGMDFTACRMFGQKTPGPAPSDVPGVDSATCNKTSGYRVHFALREDDTHLVIRTTRGSETLELVPHGQFIDDLPTLLVKNYTHWFNVFNGEIELRPLESPWESAPQNWRIHFSDKGDSRMCKESSFLIDIRSPTFQMIASCLGPLEHAEYLTVTCLQDGHSLSVDLPRFRLSFFLNSEGLLESQNIPRTVIDSDQSTGTMFGLDSQLVLRAKDQVSAQLPRSRLVIIPHGKRAHFRPQGNHISINIDTRSEDKVKYYQYSIDTDLGCLVGNSSLTSKLYKFYLHALSSHCLPDPLTGCTGTEEALRGLSSASCRSFQKLEAAETDLLRRIGSLTPSRTFYPQHLEVMQTVDWSDFAPTAQHHGFYTITQSIMKYAERLRVFHEQPELEAQLLNNVHLLERAGRRAAIFYPEDFRGPLPPGHGNVVYNSRHSATDEAAEEESHVFNTSSMVHHWPSKMNTSRQLFDTLNQWGRLSGKRDGLTLSYNRDWLQRDLAESWIPLYDLCRECSKDESRFQLIFSLSALSYGSPESRNLIPTLLSFATTPHFRTLSPPPWDSYDLPKGFEPQKKELLRIIHSFADDFDGAGLPANSRQSDIEHAQHRHQTQVDSRAEELLNILTEEWPREKPSSPPNKHWPFNIPSTMSQIEPLFRSWFRNSRFRKHIGHVQAALDKAHGEDIDPAQTYATAYKWELCPSDDPSTSSVITFDQLFKRPAPGVSRQPIILGTAQIPTENRSSPDTSDLKVVLSEFRSNVFHRLYGDDLEKSRKSLGEQPVSVFPNIISHTMEILAYHRDQCRKHLQDIFVSIYQSLSPSTLVETMMCTAGLWPRITTRSLLGKLAFGSNTVLTNPWSKVLISFAQGMLLLQRSQRLLLWASLQNHDEFFKELGHWNQDAIENPDWLLIQVDSNFLARPTQTRVAQEMIVPSSGQNTVLQFNMGEGKSSVIVPLAAASLADGHKLMRVVVLKPLSSQMFQLLVERLSGLANRQIFYMPFSRKGKLEAQHAHLIQKLYEDCMREGGILVVQPEHILSFTLMGIDRLLCSTSSADREVTDTLLESQRWLEKNSRDILDESDEILHVRYQLVYTVGQHQPVDDHPDRWTTVQQILSLVKKHVPLLQRRFPNEVEVGQGGHDGSFPSLRILQVKAGQDLVSLIAKNALDGALLNHSFGLFPEPVRQVAMRMITEVNIPAEDSQLIREHCESGGTWKGLLLLRGLLAFGILLHTLKDKRWRVDYGLDLNRSLLAVPYRAKDVPALRAEFGHPDVAIVLTCLSYYYGGLTIDQLDQCFELLFKLDNPTTEYEKWIHDSVPKTLHKLSGVNTRDPEQREQYLIPLFQRNHAVVDFFLSQVVFPKEAREFPEKLSASGWDIASTKTHVTTGFSGTNDNRYLLPTSISQHDPPEQLSTNARVLSYILQSENDHYRCIPSQNGERLLTESFLKLLGQETPKIRILLDVGAQMLELQNAELAKVWLSVEPEVQAAIYFGDNDKLVVMTRDHTVEAFVSSPFNQQLDKCLVYLDDVHTRGTDLKLPRNSRAAVTLGPKVTKDRLLQGCMRLRKLGYGQSVIFFAPSEVDRSIRTVSKKSSNDGIKALDILRWVMLETCADIMHHVPHWAQQGMNYESRRKSWLEFSPSDDPIARLKSAWLQPEARILETLYKLPQNVGLDTQMAHYPAIRDCDNPDIHKRCEMLGVSAFSDVQMEEEQEREVDHELERECQVERPPKAEPATHSVHKDVREFIQTGIIPPNPSQFLPAFSPLYEAATYPRLSSSVWSPNLLATKDFSTTIQSSPSTGAYLRPVNWIISCPSDDGTILVILSPYEVNELLPEIRKSRAVHLHQYSPRVTQAMKSFDDLKFHCIPPLPTSWLSPTSELVSQLNLWAGQLYVPDHGTYLWLCEFMGVYAKTDGSEDDILVQPDGFISPSDRRGRMRSICSFEGSPLPFLKEFVGLRRKGMGYLSTHMWKILHARPLTEDDF